jgi:hypothetical protein
MQHVIADPVLAVARRGHGGLLVGPLHPSRIIAR